MDTAAAAGHLFAHRRDRRLMADLPAGLRPTDLAEAYAVQDELVARLIAADSFGAPPDGPNRAIGYKVACTNTIAQRALQIDRPLFGRMLASSTFASPATLEAERFTTRVVEAEFGVLVGRDVPAGQGPHDRESIAPYVGAVLPSIEIVDHRFEDWSVGALSVAADNAIHGCWVPGPTYEGDWRAVDLAAHEVAVLVDGVVATTGTGAAVLGHPLSVVAWLADELEAFGRQLRAGELITTGVCTDVFEAQAGQQIVADFGQLGRVEISWG